MPFCELLEGVKSDGKRVYRRTEKGLERANERTRGSGKERIHDLAKILSGHSRTDSRVLDFGAKFYQYSARNTMLIYKQNRGATFVQSFKNWKDMGHPVKRGEHGLNILVPVQCTLIKDDGAYIPLREATKEQKELFKAGKLESATVFTI